MADPLETAAERERAEDEAIARKLRTRYVRKVGFTTAAIASAGLGLLFSLLFLLDFEHLLRLLEGGELVQAAGALLREHAPSLADTLREVMTSRLARVVAAALVNLVFLVLVLVGALAVSFAIARRAGRIGDFSRYGLFCLRLARGSRTTGSLVMLAGVGLLAGGVVVALRHLGVAATLYLTPLGVGVGLALLALGLAILLPLGRHIEEAEALPEPPPAADPAATEARATGKELLAHLRESPVFRRQVVLEKTLAGDRFVRADADGLGTLLRRYPRLAAVLPHTGIERLSSDQSEALASVFEAEDRARGQGYDHVFVGWPGSGRTTLANLLALSSVLHREGAMYCVTAESPTRSVDEASVSTPATTARHPATQLGRWLDAAGLRDTVRMGQAYIGDEVSDLQLSRRPDIVFTDVRMMADAVLSNLGGDARDLIARLKYVIIDHPNRLGREELVRLRLAICRLRMTAELLGQPLDFVVILPRLSNHAELAKWLLNNANVQPKPFKSWPGDCELVGWLPPLELLDIDADRPLLVRASFTDEVINLLTELGAHSHDFPEPLRIGIVDASPLLGPEARDQIRERVELQLSRTVEGETFTVRHSWTYFATEDLSVDRSSAFDVVVVIGVGSHPEHLVSTLRGTLAKDGLLLLVADSSPADVESLRGMGQDHWDPREAIEKVRYPSLVIPDHSEAVIAHELASLLEDFRDRPLPRERIVDTFPGEHTLRLLAAWEAARHVEPVRVFDASRDGRSVAVRPYLRCHDKTFGRTLYEIPWGCCSRAVYRVYDRAAHNVAATQRRLQEHVDADRLFIDLYPRAVLRFPPGSVEVAGRTEKPLGRAEREQARRKAVVRGNVEVSTPNWEEAIAIDRRTPRFALTLVSERPTAAAEAALRGVAEIPSTGLEGALRVAEPDGDAAAGGGADRARRTAAITATVQRPALSGVRTDDAVQLLGGTWVGRVRETLRDVVRTDRRLVGEPTLTYAMTVPGASRYTRDFETIATSVFFRLATAPEGDGADTEPAAAGDGTAGPEDGGAGDADGASTGGADGADERRPSLATALDSRPAHHGVARLVQRYLGRRYLNFDVEFRTALVPNDDRAGGLSGWRLLLYRLRQDELGTEHDSLADRLWRPRFLGEMFGWIRDRLVQCDCPDGCARCCGGLGALPEDMAPRTGFAEADVVSRRKAYALVCGVLGVAPDWETFYRGVIGTIGEEDGIVGGTDEELARYVIEIVGTPNANFQDGAWARLFGDAMVLDERFVAPAYWGPEGTGPENAIGWYSPAKNRVFIRPNLTPDFVRRVLVHEFAHNWQFEAEQFDLEEHLHGPEAKKFFEGKLVIEGHATWAEHRYILAKGLGGCYEPNDHRPWDEYKVGYFLIEGIEKAVGERGLFAWLLKGVDSDERHVRSRNPRLTWPFTTEDALKALGLRERALGGRFTDFDVTEDEDEPDPPPPEPGDGAGSDADADADAAGA